MAKCERCGKPVYVSYNGVYLCEDCLNKQIEENIEKKSKDIKKADDLAGWSSEDVSEMFWINLGKYVKEPNEETKSKLKTAFYWAVHSDHGLSNSFMNALKWAKVDIWNNNVGE